MPFSASPTLCTDCRTPHGGFSAGPCPDRAHASACPPLIVLAMLAAEQAALPGHTH